MNPKKVFEVANYFIYKSESESRIDLTNKKLNKLLYYSKAWFYTLNGTEIFENNVKAWVHGPVIVEVYQEYKKYGFGKITQVISENDFSKLTKDERSFLDEVWSIYGKRDADYLELLTHSEDPWQNARQGLSSFDNSDNNITLESMKTYYSSMLAKSKNK